MPLIGCTERKTLRATLRIIFSMPKSVAGFNAKGQSAGEVAKLLSPPRVKALKWFAEHLDGASRFGPDMPSIGTVTRLYEVGALDLILPEQLGGFVTYRINEFGRAVVAFLRYSQADLEILRRATANAWSDKFDLRARTVVLSRLVNEGLLEAQLRPGKTTQYRLTKEGRKVLKGDYEQA